MFARHLAGAGYQVCVADTDAISPPAGRAVRCMRGDIASLGPALAAEVGQADLVLLAVPENVAVAAVGGVIAAMRPGALLVDTLSVKTPMVAAICRAVRAPAVRRATTAGTTTTGSHASRHPRAIEAVSLNPMFAPSLGIAGRPVAAVVVRDGPRARELLQLIGEWGGRVVNVGVAQHDRLASAAQALTHATVLAFGLALADLGFDVTDLGAIAPAPHVTLLALLARIAGGTEEVYWDVQSANPLAAPARTALARGARRLADLIDAGDRAGFDAVLSQLSQLLGADSARYRDICARMFLAMGDGTAPSEAAAAP
jgi:prephenate dehydrogenase